MMHNARAASEAAREKTLAAGGTVQEAEMAAVTAFIKMQEQDRKTRRQAQDFRRHA